MAVTVAQAIKVLEERAMEDAALAETLLFLADDVNGPDDPFGAPGPGVVAAARSVNEQRQRDRRHSFAANALDTAEVVALIDSINDRKGVDRRLGVASSSVGGPAPARFIQRGSSTAALVRRAPAPARFIQRGSSTAALVRRAPA